MRTPSELQARYLLVLLPKRVVREARRNGGLAHCAVTQQDDFVLQHFLFIAIAHCSDPDDASPLFPTLVLISLVDDSSSFHFDLLHGFDCCKFNFLDFPNRSRLESRLGASWTKFREWNPPQKLW